MPEMTGVIEGVYNDGPRIDVKAGGRKLSTWKEDLGRLARSLEGQECVIKYTVKQKGEYENFYFDGAKPVEQAPAPEPPAWTGESNQLRRTDIRWATAWNSAVSMAGGPDADLQALFALADLIFAGLSKRQDGGA